MYSRISSRGRLISTALRISVNQAFTVVAEDQHFVPTTQLSGADNGPMQYLWPASVSCRWSKQNEAKLLGLEKLLHVLKKSSFLKNDSSSNDVGEISSFEELIDRIEYKCLDSDIPFMNIWIRTILIPIIYQNRFKEYLLERLMALYYIRDFGSEINTREMDNYGYPKEELSMLNIIVEAVNYNSDNDEKTDILDLTIE